jgi:hypothetical protein
MFQYCPILFTENNDKYDAIVIDWMYFWNALEHVLGTTSYRNKRHCWLMILYLKENYYSSRFAMYLQGNTLF